MESFQPAMSFERLFIDHWLIKLVQLRIRYFPDAGVQPFSPLIGKANFKGTCFHTKTQDRTR